MHQSLTKHRRAITEAHKLLMSQTLHLELALLGDDEQQQRRWKHTTMLSMNALQNQIACLVEDYDLAGVQERVKEQLI